MLRSGCCDLAQVAVQVLAVAALRQISSQRRALQLGDGQVAAVLFTLLVDGQLLLTRGRDLAGDAVEAILLPAGENQLDRRLDWYIVNDVLYPNQQAFVACPLWASRRSCTNSLATGFLMDCL